jgi:hypothetical protein
VARLKAAPELADFDVAILFLAQVLTQGGDASGDFVARNVEAKLFQRVEEKLPVEFKLVTSARAPYAVPLRLKFQLKSSVLNVGEHPQVNFVFDGPNIRNSLDSWDSITDTGVVDETESLLPRAEIQDPFVIARESLGQGAE